MNELTSTIPHIDILPWWGFREPFSSLSHLAGAVLFASLAPNLVRRGRGDPYRIASLSIFALTSVFLLISSGIYHSRWPGPEREFFLTLDIAGVFVMIAASMTPVHAILFSGRARWMPLVLIWCTAISGIVWRTFDRGPLGFSGVLIFLSFGWGGIVTAYFLIRRYGWKFALPAGVSGMSYTLGAICLMFHRPILIPQVIGPHELWHVAVLIGLGLHWVFVYQFAEHDPPLKSVRHNKSAEPVFEFLDSRTLNSAIER